MPHDLQPHGGLARPLFAEHDRRGRLGRIAVDLVPGRMIRAGDAEFLEDRIGLRVFLGKRIGANAVMFEKLLRFHAGSWFSLIGTNGDCKRPSGESSSRTSHAVRNGVSDVSPARPRSAAVICAPNLRSS